MAVPEEISQLLAHSAIKFRPEKIEFPVLLVSYIDITDGSSSDEDMKQLLQFTDNMPLAVDLIAHLVDYEGHTNVLTRWGTEKTSLLSAGDDRRSNLDASIRVSLSSPRITSGAKDLLSLL
jgi:hypothetical protein